MKFSEIKPGMMIEGYGLVVGVKPEELKNTNICYYELEDPYYGPVCTWAPRGECEEEYTILHEVDTPEYKEKVAYIRSEIEKHQSNLAEYLVEIDSLSSKGPATKARPWW